VRLRPLNHHLSEYVWLVAHVFTDPLNWALTRAGDPQTTLSPGQQSKISIQTP